ncbi:MAG: hypothetical protein AAFQ82_23445, partial [Myxococcota bacterium]
HARRPIVVDGTPIGVSSCAVSGPLSGDVSGAGFEGRVELKLDEDYSCIRWIEHEVLSAERFSQLAGGVAHDAVVYADLESARDEAVEAVRDFRESRIAGLSAGFGSLDPPVRSAVRAVLFSRVIERRDVALLGAAPVFSTVDGRSLSVLELRERARRGPIEVTGLESTPGAASSAVRLSALGRRVVGEILGLPMTGAGPLAEGGRIERLRILGQRGWLATGAWFSGAWARLVRGRAVVRSALTPQERRFQNRLQSLLESGEYRVPRFEPRVSRLTRVEFVQRGPLPLTALSGKRPTLLLPRSNGTLRRIILAYERDPNTLYPALDLLFAGKDGWGSRRSQWRRRLLDARSL